MTIEPGDIVHDHDLGVAQVSMVFAFRTGCMDEPFEVILTPLGKAYPEVHRQISDLRVQERCIVA